MQTFKITSLSEKQLLQIRQLLNLVGWNRAQIEGQIEAIEKFLRQPKTIVILADIEGELAGYISAELYSWNRLGQIHGLVVNPHFRRKKIASQLVKGVEDFMKQNQARGLYVDTPINNAIGCNFYLNQGFQQSYIMPHYYDKDLDGVTFQKFF